MNTSRNILIAVDGAEVSNRAVTYVAGLIGACRGFRVHLLHILPPLPPELLEVGGSEDPDVEQREEALACEQQAAWLAHAEESAQPILDQAKSILREAKVPFQAMESECVIPINGEAIVTDILEAAQANQCGTIVVGRSPFHGLRAWFGQHLGDKLIRQGEGLAIWVVE
jgi:nucleotide-binding universal stress UspA family protein